VDVYSCELGAEEGLSIGAGYFEFEAIAFGGCSLKGVQTRVTYQFFIKFSCSPWHLGCCIFGVAIGAICMCIAAGSWMV